MVDNVNFLAQQQKQVAQRDQIDRVAFIVTIVTAVVIGLIYGGLFFWKTNVDSQVQAEKTRQQTLTNNINSAANQENNYLAFYEKLKKITLLAGKRTHGTQSLVDTYRYFTTEDTALTSSTYDYYSQMLELSLVANSAFSLEQLLDLIQDSAFRDQYSAVEVLSLSRTSTGTYQLRVSLMM